MATNDNLAAFLANFGHLGKQLFAGLLSPNTPKEADQLMNTLGAITGSGPPGVNLGMMPMGPKGFPLGDGGIPPLYHGTQREFLPGMIKPGEGTSGPGIYLTPEANRADIYTQSNRGIKPGAAVHAFRLHPEVNILHSGSKLDNAVLDKLSKHLTLNELTSLPKYRQIHKYDGNYVRGDEFRRIVEQVSQEDHSPFHPEKPSQARYLELMQKMGYDAYVPGQGSGEWVVFNPAKLIPGYSTTPPTLGQMAGQDQPNPGLGRPPAPETNFGNVHPSILKAVLRDPKYVNMIPMETGGMSDVGAWKRIKGIKQNTGLNLDALPVDNPSPASRTINEPKAKGPTHPVTGKPLSETEMAIGNWAFDNLHDELKSILEIQGLPNADPADISNWVRGGLHALPPEQVQAELGKLWHLKNFKSDAVKMVDKPTWEYIKFWMNKKRPPPPEGPPGINVGDLHNKLNELPGSTAHGAFMDWLKSPANERDYRFGDLKRQLDPIFGRSEEEKAVIREAIRLIEEFRKRPPDPPTGGTPSPIEPTPTTPLQDFHKNLMGEVNKRAQEHQDWANNYLREWRKASPEDRYVIEKKIHEEEVRHSQMDRKSMDKAVWKEASRKWRWVTGLKNAIRKEGGFRWWDKGKPWDKG